MSVEISCPYCNALMPATSAAPGERVTCARCGESFVYTERSAGASRLTSGDPTTVSDPAAVSRDAPAERSFAGAVSSPRLSNGALAGIIVGGMFLIAGLALLFALFTMPERIANHQGIIKPESTSLPLFLKLLALAWIVGLIYLLNDVWQRIRGSEQAGWYRGVIMVIAVQTVLAVLLVTLWSRNRSTQSREPLNFDLEAIGRQAVKPVPPAELSGLAYLPADVNVVAGLRVAGLEPGQLAKNLRTLWPEGPPLPFEVSQLADWTGLHWDELDHVVIGVKVHNQIPPPTVLAAVTRRPVDVARVIETLKAQALPGAEGRYRFKIKKPAAEAVLWCLPDRQTFLIGLVENDFASIAAKPAGSKLPASLQALIGERMGPHTWAWVAVHELAPPRGLNLPVKFETPLPNVRTAGIWLEPLVEPSLHGAFLCADKSAGDAIERLAKEKLKDCKSRRQGDWLLLQASPGRPEK